MDIVTILLYNKYPIKGPLKGPVKDLLKETY